ncbi:protein SCO1/2 [Oxalobacteraceae bacterium GrIS 1.11]
MAKRLGVSWLAALLFASAGADELNTRPRQQFTAPSAGSYVLQVIQQAPKGRVLDSDGLGYDVQRFTRGKITLLSFMYSYCTDPIGCPLAFSTMYGLRERLLAQADLAPRVRFVSLSFDPVNDTPQVMRLYGGQLADPSSALRWHFLTTASLSQLRPIIDELGQSVQVQKDAQGRPSRLYHHMLKMFLFDAEGRVREIYSSAFLQPEVMFNDIKTLSIEQDRAARAPR